MNDVLVKLKRHDVADNEVRKISGEIERLEDDATELVNRYPGQDAQSVQRALENVRKNAEIMKRTVAKRRSDLENLAAAHKWLNAARALQKWGDDTLASMAPQSRENVSVDLLLQQHDDIKGDILAHRPDFEKLLVGGGPLAGQAGPLSSQVKERARELLLLQEKMQKVWDARRAALEEDAYVRKFLRDLDQLDHACNAQVNFRLSFHCFVSRNCNRQIYV